MDSTMSHEELLELLGAYAVHALEPDEMTAVQRHLPGCHDCQDEVDRLLDASASLGLTASEPLPAELWGRIVADVRATPTHEANAPQASERISRAAPVIALDAAREARRDRRSKWRIAVVSAAAAAAITAPLTSVFTSSPAPSLAALADRAASEPGSQTIALRAPDGTELAEAIVTVSGKGYVRRDTLPALPAGSTYQLWAVAAGTPVSAGLLGSDPDTAAFTVDTDIEALAISVEPRAGSAAPSATPVALGAASA